MECQKCGLCCKTWQVDVVLEDRERWIKEKREDILDELIFIENKGLFIRNTTIKPVQPCVFLKGENHCSIYETRPLTCRLFPEWKNPNDCWCPGLLLGE